MSAEADYLHAERDNAFKTLDLLDELVAKETRSQYETIALGKLLQDVYTGIERILRSLLEERGLRLERSESWHKDLLLAADESGIVTDEEFKSFRKLLLFRHVQVHGYGFMLEEERLLEIAQITRAACRGFLEGIV
jgi:uncharacterized protein YutE (UPF0331/DUF86 family)